LPFPENSFDLVTSIDVIYHKSIKEDARALGEFNRVLARGGYLVLRVPANRWLHSKHDVHVHTRERYELPDLKHKLTKTGFKITRLTYVNFSLFPLAIAKQIFESFGESSPQSGIQKTNGALNLFLGFFLRLENFILLSGLNLPVGIGLVAVCQKR
jgi:SAM-dependent methyltransferase